MHRTGLLAWIGIVLVGCAGSGEGGRTVRYHTGSGAAATADGLHRMRAYRTDALFVLPEADLSGYRGFSVAPVEIYYRQGEPGERINRFMPKEEKWFQDAVQREIELAFGETLARAEVAEDGVFVVRAQFTEFALGNPRRPAVGDVKVVSRSRFRLYLDLSDPVTGESFLRQVDTREVTPSSLNDPLPQAARRPTSTKVTHVEERAALRLEVRNRARALHESFERIRAGGTVPRRRW